MFAQIVSVIVYLVPLALVTILWARRERRLAELAVLIPATVAVDLLVVMLLCRLVRLEWAAIVSRVLWVAGAALWFDRRLRRNGIRPARPSALDRRSVAGLLLGAVTGGALSMILSRPKAIWDRELHIPFVASLRGQQMPFASPFEPGIAFHYHFSGDVLASMLQVFSFSVINASLALSLAHDVMFVLIALATGLALMESGSKPVHVVVLSVAAVLLSGPCVLRFGVGEPYLGYSYYALYIWGFRSHQHVAMLLFVGIASVLIARNDRDDRNSPARGGPIAMLVAMMGLLSVTDETSAAVLGLSLGVAWLVDPTLLAPTRRRGLVLFGLLLVAFIGTNLVFAGSLAPGGPVQNLSFVAPRSPGVQQPPLPLSTPEGLIALVADAFPIWTILLALLFVAARRGHGAAPLRRGLVVFAVVLAIVSIVGLTIIDVNGGPPEGHRFLTAALFVFPVLGVLCYDRWWRAGTLGRALVLAALTLGAGSTVLWLSHYPKHPTPESYFRQRGKNLHTSDCRALAGARFGQEPALTYVESSIFYAYTGCRPSFVVGEKRTKYWTRKEYPTLGIRALRELDSTMLPAGATVDAVCPAGRGPGDVDEVCAHALTRTTCTPDGSDFLRCPLTPADRRAILVH
ncbi:MAG TPA: hypothetical protein VN903_30520 [Polyangia bacterium]|nr:hypothetical protein [Polyangia bacterium]